ncbi:MAG: hypothetical protein HY445_02230 [Candidatus Niyogibacteria bacterium]|nr:hypothetical protein [Candidatus Niyogibacteria bacterium]
MYTTKDQMYDYMRLTLSVPPKGISDKQFAFAISRAVLNIFLSQPKEMGKNISDFLRFSTQSNFIPEDIIAAEEKNYIKVDIAGCPTDEEIDGYIMPFSDVPEEGKTPNPYYEFKYFFAMLRHMAPKMIITQMPGMASEAEAMEERISRGTKMILEFLEKEPDRNMQIALIQVLLYESNVLPFATIFEGEEYLQPKDKVISSIRKDKIDEKIITKIEGLYKNFALSPERVASLMPDSIAFTLKEIIKEHPECRTMIDAPAFQKIWNVVMMIFHFHAFRLVSEFSQMEFKAMKKAEQVARETQQEELVEKLMQRVTPLIMQQTVYTALKAHYSMLLRNVMKEGNEDAREIIEEDAKKDPVTKMIYEEVMKELEKGQEEKKEVTEIPRWLAEKRWGK